MVETRRQLPWQSQELNLMGDLLGIESCKVVSRHGQPKVDQVLLGTQDANVSFLEGGLRFAVLPLRDRTALDER